ncbi:hypothetical protein CAPTEDRAFT_198580 [Capitella teleta]|uniref:Peptidase M3A/M3B catalytic domain-containing protein n=1 Tax=Capitella teleta TaxID=283909 RepID=R7UZP7_CAPTE|nr:hypothetical protein CAPTEDRAFT_198580 [Capitella teleta]|eukprot:ELU11712.1 hypothetical protein CAPTEDRAFT_198580 [Capitella teleta]
MSHLMSLCFGGRFLLPVFKRNVSTLSPLAAAFNSKREKKFNFNIGKSNVGLFNIPQLKEHSGFYLLQQNATHEAEDLVAEAASPNRKRKLVKVFDELSDCLCRVADMADFVRIAHPDQRFCQAAEDACMSISALVEKLNTNVDIHRSLSNVLKNGDSFETDAIDDRVAELFMFDFEQSGIHLPEDKRRIFVELNEKIHMLAYCMVIYHHSFFLLCDNCSLFLSFALDGDNVAVTGLFSDHHNDLVREAAYKIYLHPDQQQSDRFDSLLSSRDHLAKLVGFSSFGDRALRGTLGQSAANVMDFLETLAEEIKPLVENDISAIRDMKIKHGGSKEVMPWDLAYYAGVARHERCQVNNADLSPYFSLGCCMHGLDKIFQALFGVSLQYQEASYGELWSYDVAKLAVVHETEGTLGYIYCDLYERPGKPHQDCHFTIQGGRELDDGTYQDPIVVLMLNLPPPRGRIPSCLTASMLENLFHEFGHAMHSMLGRTRYQHVTGTRCPTDFAEVPSVLMEYFATDARVLASFARHWQTGEVLPDHMIESLCAAKKMFGPCEMQLQVFYSILDQVYHGEHPLGGSTTEILERVQNEHYSLPYVSGTAWHLRFGHFIGYGAKYYSYLMSRAVAARIWRQFFAEDPFSRASGYKYWKQVLAHGGGKDSIDLVHDLLEEKPSTKMLVQSLLNDLQT